MRFVLAGRAGSRRGRQAPDPWPRETESGGTQRSHPFLAHRSASESASWEVGESRPPCAEETDEEVVDSGEKDSVRTTICTTEQAPTWHGRE